MFFDGEGVHQYQNLPDRMQGKFSRPFFGVLIVSKYDVVGRGKADCYTG